MQELDADFGKFFEKVRSGFWFRWWIRRKAKALRKKYAAIFEVSDSSMPTEVAHWRKEYYKEFGEEFDQAVNAARAKERQQFEQYMEKMLDSKH